MENPENQINILVMGGSVTQGAWARGCICNRSNNSCNISVDLRNTVVKIIAVAGLFNFVDG